MLYIVSKVVNNGHNLEHLPQLTGFVRVMENLESHGSWLVSLSLKIK